MSDKAPAMTDCRGVPITLGCKVEQRGPAGNSWYGPHGGALQVRYPRWRADERGELVDCERPPAVPVDRRIDDGQPVDGPFDAVLVCRSGAWVPSWCDDQFEEFLEAAPVEMLWIEDRVQRDRAFDVDLARRQAEAALAALAGPQPPGA